MIVRDIVDKIDNGTAHIFLWDEDSGEVLLSTIWHNQIPNEYLDKEVKKIQILDYELRLGVV